MKRLLSLIVVSVALFSCRQNITNTITYERGTYVEVNVPNYNINDPVFVSKAIVFYPPGYDQSDTTVKYPIAYILHGFGGNYTYFRDVYDIGNILSYLIATGEAKPMILVLVNGINSFGGSFYTNSILFGNYRSYLISDLIPYIESQVIGKQKLTGERYIGGYSMGGYGSGKLAALHPDLFDKVAILSGPLGFAIYLESQVQNDLMNILKAENAKDSLVFGIDSIWIYQGDTITHKFIYLGSKVISQRFPQTFDTLVTFLLPDGKSFVYQDTSYIQNDTLVVVKFLGKRYNIQGAPIKAFTNFLVALSAAFSPKADACANFSADFDYVIQNNDPVCIGFSMPISKAIDNVDINLLQNVWIPNHDVQQLIDDNGNNIVANNVRWYISHGNYGELEVMIAYMNQLAITKLKTVYGNQFAQSVEYYTYQGDSDPFGFPATHNQYIYEEIGNMLRFFSR